jgi:hypothetical protein
MKPLAGGAVPTPPFLQLFVPIYLRSKSGRASCYSATLVTFCRRGYFARTCLSWSEALAIAPMLPGLTKP